MAEARAVSDTFAANLAIIKRQTRGLTHEDSMIEPPFRGNCLNWVLGHIIAGRNRALVAMGQPFLWSEAEQQLYDSGSDPISPATAVRLEAMLELLEEAQLRLAAALDAATPESLAAIVSTPFGPRALGDAVAGLAWHETYHTGQTELLRQLAGTNDRVIG